jgi:hypothetical protein
MSTTRVGRIARAAAVALGFALATGLLGCGDGRASDPVVKVGTIAIAPATIERWEVALSRGSGAGSVHLPRAANRREQALDFLIAGHWLIGEAAKQGLAVSPAAVALRVEERLGAHSEKTTIDRELKAMGLTLADVEFEARAQLAAASLRDLVYGHVREPTRSELVRYYERNRSSFWHEYRVVDLVEHLYSRPAALAMAKRLGTGRRFTKQAIHETVVRLTGSEAAHAANRNLVRAIYETPLGQVSKPVFYAGLWIIFIVRASRHTPVPLAAVEGRVTSILRAIRRRSALRMLFLRYRGEWRALTTCQRGFVVPGCSESHGDLDPGASQLFAE